MYWQMFQFKLFNLPKESAWVDGANSCVCMSYALYHWDDIIGWLLETRKNMFIYVIWTEIDNSLISLFYLKVVSVDSVMLN